MSATAVLQADRFQSTSDDLRKKHDIAPARRCPHHNQKLWPEKSGSVLACVVTRPATCDYMEAIDARLMSTADV